MENSRKSTFSYDPVLSFAKKHYENFPVISFLLPLDIRNHIAAVYWFARTADDIADEGELSTGERIESLNHFENRFISLLSGNFNSEYEELLYNTIISKNLTPSYFTDLISAFRQDVTKKRYKSYDEVLDYCRRSANPVGRLLLELYNIREEDANRYSDYVCTALQLTNFLQDTKKDFYKGRIYLPDDEMKSFGVDEKMFEMNEISDKLKQLAKFNVDRTRNLFREGHKILNFLKGRFKLEIKWTIGGGTEILNKIRKNNYNIFIRPELSKSDFSIILLKSFIK